MAIKFVGNKTETEERSVCLVNLFDECFLGMKTVYFAIGLVSLVIVKFFGYLGSDGLERMPKMMSSYSFEDIPFFQYDNAQLSKASYSAPEATE